jgi:hypothetical protein
MRVFYVSFNFVLLSEELCTRIFLFFPLPIAFLKKKLGCKLFIAKMGYIEGYVGRRIMLSVDFR